jgi:uncharacterized protein (TIGR03067 family)
MPMRRMGFAIAAIAALAAGSSLLAGDGKEAIERDLKKLQGTWQVVLHEIDGKATPPADLVPMKITFTGDKWSLRSESQEVQGGTHKLDPAKKPAQVDAVVTQGEGKGTTMLGIYEMKGDRMKICFDPRGKQRPTSFSSKNGHMMVIIQRDKD